MALDQTLLEFFAEAIDTGRTFRVRSKSYSLSGPVVSVGSNFAVFREVTDHANRNVIIPLSKLHYAYEITDGD